MAFVSWTSAGEMLLWPLFREHLLGKCCCGYGFMYIGWGNVAVACVAVAKVSWTLAGEMFCGFGFVGIGWRIVAVAKVSWVPVFKMLLRLRFCDCQNL